jgi:hypothetical protein
MNIGNFWLFLTPTKKVNFQIYWLAFSNNYAYYPIKIPVVKNYLQDLFDPYSNNFGHGK